jgi:hypothetical protein
VSIPVLFVEGLFQGRFATASVDDDADVNRVIAFLGGAENEMRAASIGTLLTRGEYKPQT